MSDACHPWPVLDYNQFKSTGYLLHMGLQVLGKLKLLTPFEPHWANVPLWVTSRGLTTGLIPYHSSAFSIDVDMIEHRIILNTSWGSVSSFDLIPMSVARFTQELFSLLRKQKIMVRINMKPQEVPHPILFDQDVEQREYNPQLAHDWWRILLSTHCVMQQYHACFDGETPPIGLMWGTFDLRDARYNGTPVETTGINAGYIRRNAMDEAQVEAGWWSGNEGYPRPAYYSFTYPQPTGIEHAKIKPSHARWDEKLSLFILDYDDVRQAADPEKELLEFFISTYQAGSALAGWEAKLNSAGKPI